MSMPVSHSEPTPAAAWRDTFRDVLVRLPGSGFVARIRRPSLTSLLATQNGVPNPISDHVVRLMASRMPVDDAARVAQFRANTRGMLEVAALCFVSPRLILDREPNYDADEIGPQDVPDLDISWLYVSWVEGEGIDLLPFLVRPYDPQSTERGAGMVEEPPPS